jgi:hypothetical protein
MGGLSFAALDGTRHVHVQLQGLVVWQVRHQAMFRPAGKNFPHQVMQLREHGIA